MHKYLVGVMLIFGGILLVTSGFYIPYGVTGALVSGGVGLCIWGAVLCTED